MIHLSSSKLSVLKTKVYQGTSWSDIICNLLSDNNEETQCIINEQSDSYIGGYYLFNSFTNQTVYNFEENKFDTTTLRKQIILKFDILPSLGKTLLWGNKKVASLFVTALEKSSKNKIITEYSETDFNELILKLLSEKTLSFSKMKINDVIIDKGIVANCSVKLEDLPNARQLVEKYIKTISQISFTIGKEINPVSVTIYSSGSVVIYKDRDDIDVETFNTLIAIFGGD